MGVRKLKLKEARGISAALARHPGQFQRIHGIVPRHGDNSLTVGHHDVFPLPGHLESSSHQRFDGPEMGDAGNPRHGLRRNFHFPQTPLAGQTLGHFEIFADGVPNVR